MFDLWAKVIKAIVDQEQFAISFFKGKLSLQQNINDETTFCCHQGQTRRQSSANI